jgi:hypothetical protein
VAQPPQQDRAGERVGQHPGVGFRRQLAPLDRLVEHLHERGRAHLGQLARQLGDLVAALGGVDEGGQQAGQPALGHDDQVGQVAQQRHHPVAHGPRRRRRARLVGPQEGVGDDCGLGRPVPVDRALGHARAGGDRLDGQRAVADLAQQVDGGGEDVVA